MYFCCFIAHHEGCHHNEMCYNASAAGPYFNLFQTKTICLDAHMLTQEFFLTFNFKPSIGQVQPI